MFLNKKCVYVDIATDRRAWISVVVVTDDPEQRPITLSDVQRVIAEHAGLEPDEFITTLNFDAPGLVREDFGDDEEDDESDDEEDDEFEPGPAR